MRIRNCLAAATVLVALVACSDDDGAKGLDIDSVTATFNTPVSVDGNVYAVSGGGSVLVQAESSDQLCVDRVDGTEVRCFEDVGFPDRSDDAIAFSPDDEQVAFTTRSADFDGRTVTVLDVATGTSQVLDEGAHTGDVISSDLWPKWVDDRTVTFLRVPVLQGNQPKIVRVRTDDADAEPEAHDVDGLDIRDAGSSVVTIVDGDLVLGILTDDGSKFVRVDEDGSTEEIGSVDDRVSVAGLPSDDRGVFITNLQVIRDIGMVTVHDDDIASIPGRVGSAAVAPDGRTIAAAGFDGNQFQVELYSFDGEDHTTLTAGEGEDVIDGRSVAWTDDDQLIAWRPDGWQVIDLRNG